MALPIWPAVVDRDPLIHPPSYRVLPSFTGFYWVLPSFPGFFLACTVVYLVFFFWVILWTVSSDGLIAFHAAAPIDGACRSQCLQNRPSSRVESRGWEGKEGGGSGGH